MIVLNSIVALLSSVVVLGQAPTPPNPQQFTLTAAKPKGGRQYMVTTNYVDRLAQLFRIDVTNDGELFEQSFYYGSQKAGYIIYYDQNPPRCVQTPENYADMLAEWQTLSYSGKTHSILNPKIECNMWNKTVENWTWSYLASIKDNTPVEILDNSILISVYQNYTVGPSAVPQKVFELPVPKSSCKK